MKYDRCFIIKYWNGVYDKFGIMEFDSQNHFINDEFLTKCNNKTFFEYSIPFNLSVNRINDKILFLNIEEV